LSCSSSDASGVSGGLSGSAKEDQLVGGIWRLVVWGLRRERKPVSSCGLCPILVRAPMLHALELVIARASELPLTARKPRSGQSKTCLLPWCVAPAGKVTLIPRSLPGHTIKCEYSAHSCVRQQSVHIADFRAIQWLDTARTTYSIVQCNSVNGCGELRPIPSQ
jgi:hypothetical protein